MIDKYFSLGKPIKVKNFEKNFAPIGWVRQDILINKLKTNKEFKNKFSKEELKIVKRKGL